MTAARPPDHHDRWEAALLWNAAELARLLTRSATKPAESAATPTDISAGMTNARRFRSLDLRVRLRDVGESAGRGTVERVDTVVDLLCRVCWSTPRAE